MQRARVILLDEATASLDDAALAAVDGALGELPSTPPLCVLPHPPARSVRASLFPSSGACAAAATILLVAHQTAAVARGDRVLVMEAGRVVQDGTPQALLADETGAYARLVKQDARRLV